MAIEPKSPHLYDMKWCWNGKYVPLKNLSKGQLQQAKKFILSRKRNNNELIFGFLWYSWLDAIEYTMRHNEQKLVEQQVADYVNTKFKNSELLKNMQL